MSAPKNPTASAVGVSVLIILVSNLIYGASNLISSPMYRVVAICAVACLSLFFLRRSSRFELAIFLVKKENISPAIIKTLYKFDYLSDDDMPILNNLRATVGNKPLKYTQEGDRNA